MLIFIRFFLKKNRKEFYQDIEIELQIMRIDEDDESS